MAADKWSRTIHVAFRSVPVLACAAGAAMPLHSRAPSNTSAGTITRITMHGRALEGNVSGESPDRWVTIYRPPSRGKAPWAGER